MSDTKAIGAGVGTRIDNQIASYREGARGVESLLKNAEKRSASK